MDELQISGKRFISARRIARENGYTSDYIGQLIRGGKIVGQKVGRAWYVDAASFDAYLGVEGNAAAPEAEVEEIVEKEEVMEEPAEVEAPQETPEVKEDKEVAAPIIEEEEAAQEVQEEESIEEKIIEEELSEAIPAEPKKVVEEVQHVPLRLAHEPKEKESGLRYYTDETPSLPEISRHAKESRVVRETEEVTPMAHVQKMPATPSRNRSRGALAALIIGGIAVFVFSAVVSSAVTLNLKIQEGNTASASYSFSW